MTQRSPWLTAAFALAILAACEPAPESGSDSTETPAGDIPAVRPDAPTGPLNVRTGLATPESVRHDPEADVYLVSNINGTPLDKDNNGYIARVLPDGRVENERWIQGGRNNVTLHAPKGLALKGDTLFVADIDTLRAFHRTTGQPLGQIGVPGATFLNDVFVAADGTVYVTDSGLNAEFGPTGTDAVYAIRDGQPQRVAAGEALSHPNGIAVAGDTIFIAPFGAPTVLRVTGGQPQVIATLPGGSLDGLVRLDDGTLLVSSWDMQTVYHIQPGGPVTAIAEGLPSPADIDFDARRRLVLVPIFTENRLEGREFPNF